MRPSETTHSATIGTLVRLIGAVRVDLSSEKRAQEQLAAAFTAAAISFDRERALGPQDRPDFLVAGGIAVECKLRGCHRATAVFRQLERYAAHDEVTAVILASNLSMGLPETVRGKPLYRASLSAGWM